MSTKKQKKPKQKTVSLQEFTASLEPTTPTSGQNVIYAPKKPMISSWADEVEEYELITEKERILLPSAPRASRGSAYEDSHVPRVPPYKAHLGNISYDIDDEDVFRFFNGLEVGELRLPRDSNNRLRGFGYVEFRNREDLVEALIMNEQMLRGRPLRISLGIAHGESGDGRRNAPVDETPADWRAPSLDKSPSQNFYPGSSDYGRGSSFYNRRSEVRGGRHGYDQERIHSAYDRPAPAYSNDFYGGRGDAGPRRAPQRLDFDSHRPPIREAYGRGGGYGGSDLGRGRHDDHYPPHTHKEEEWRDPHYQQRNPVPVRPNDIRPVVQKESNRDPTPVASPRSSTSDETRMKSPTSPRTHQSPPRERKKLILQPRTKSTSESDPSPSLPASNSKSSIFGEAKPVDTAAKEREVEKKLAEMSLLEAKKSRLIQRPKVDLPPPVDFNQRKSDTSQRFRRDSSSRPHPPPLMAEPSSPPRIFTNSLAPLRRRRSDEIDRDKDTSSEPEDDRDLRFIEFHRVDRKGRYDPGREPASAAGDWRGIRATTASAVRSGDGPRVN